jgi:hypothetical protein
MTNSQALAGVMAYPLQGLYKTCYTAIHSQTRKEIAAQRLNEGRYLCLNMEETRRPRPEEISKAFELLFAKDNPKAEKKASKQAEKERKKQEKLEKNQKVKAEA